MENVFPHLLTFGLFAPFILRITLAALLLTLGWSMITGKRIATSVHFETRDYPLARVLPWLLGIAIILTGLFFLFGFFTQIAVLLAIYTFLTLMFIERTHDPMFRIFPYSPTFYLVLMIIATSLLFSGAGAFAVDSLL